MYFETSCKLQQVLLILIVIRSFLHHFWICRGIALHLKLGHTSWASLKIVSWIYLCSAVGFIAGTLIFSSPRPVFPDRFLLLKSLLLDLRFSLPFSIF